MAHGNSGACQKEWERKITGIKLGSAYLWAMPNADVFSSVDIIILPFLNLIFTEN